MTLKGRIARLVPSKGFGFIESGSAEYFFHRSVLDGVPFEALHVGDAVSFTQGTSAPGKGPRAGSVFVDVSGEPRPAA